MVRHGFHPFLECSSRGERRLSAFYARILGRGGKSIEEIYQASKVFEDGSTGLHWKVAKGRKAVNQDKCATLYSTLWDEYISENPDLMDVIIKAPGLSDAFGTPGSCCQATELWRIRESKMAEMKLDDLAHGAVTINPQKYSEHGFEKALEAANEYMRSQKVHDPALWTKDQWRAFVWRIFSAGTHAMITITEEKYREALRGMDEIPY